MGAAKESTIGHEMEAGMRPENIPHLEKIPYRYGAQMDSVSVM